MNEALEGARERFTEKRADGARTMRGSGAPAKAVLWSMRGFAGGGLKSWTGVEMTTAVHTYGFHAGECPNEIPAHAAAAIGHRVYLGSPTSLVFQLWARSSTSALAAMAGLDVRIISRP